LRGIEESNHGVLAGGIAAEGGNAGFASQAGNGTDCPLLEIVQAVFAIDTADQEF
jgi:hypothetical protein